MNEAQLVIAKSMSEKDLSDNIVSLARMLGYLVHRDPTWRATGTDAGYPDLTLVQKDGAGYVIWAELKREGGKQTAAQLDWQTAIGGAYVVWTPVDWLSGRIEEVLRR